MANVLIVAALELGDPMLLIVLVQANNLLFHRYFVGDLDVATFWQ